MTTATEIRAHVEEAWDRRASLTGEDLSRLAPLLDAGFELLNRGDIRAASPNDEKWEVNAWVQKLVLLYFRSQSPTASEPVAGMLRSFDKIPLKFASWTDHSFTASGVRVAPGAVVRNGAYIGPGTILMPSFVNVGAFVGARTTIDTWATVGSCAQVGEDCHISGGVGLGGVLEPAGQRPVVIEDRVFVGARSEIAEGVHVRRGAVIGMGVFLGASTPIVDRATGQVTYGEVPENAVVIAGSRVDKNDRSISLAAAIIVKRADDRTRSKTSLNDLLRP